MRQGIYYSSPSTNVLHKKQFPLYISLANVWDTANNRKFVYLKQVATKETWIFCDEILATFPKSKNILKLVVWQVTVAVFIKWIILRLTTTIIKIFGVYWKQRIFWFFNIHTIEKWSGNLHIDSKPKTTKSNINKLNPQLSYLLLQIFSVSCLPSSYFWFQAIVQNNINILENIKLLHNDRIISRVERDVSIT